jgi:shikimate dehydrogenase
MKAELRLALIGDPVVHSSSPRMHTAALEVAGIPGAYRPLRVTAENLEKFVPKLVAELDGFNVTMPHKETICQFLDRLDLAAEAIGAVNTVVVRDGESIGFNTDASGFGRMLDTLPWRGRSAVVMGAGGAARGCVYALSQREWRITVTNRSVERARTAFAAYHGVRVIGLENLRTAHLEDACLLINATSVGMATEDVSPLPSKIELPAALTVLELVSSPVNTALVRAAEARGCTIVDGLNFLAYQAADSFALWTGTRLDDGLFLDAAWRTKEQ